MRDYVPVDDLGQAHLLGLESLFAGKGSAVYHIGNSKGYSVREVIEVAARVSGRSIPVVEAGRREGDPAVLVAGADKIRKEFGRQPRYEQLETIIETVWRWHQREAEELPGKVAAGV